jgi:pimeloyl-ACP methyl ester carboxylesterase
MPFAHTEDAQLYYEVHGAGYPLIFIHGGGGNTMAWFQQVPYFARTYKVITVDLRGFKHSRCSPELVHPRFFPDDMRAIMDAEGLPEAAFICQSLGAWAGLPVAVFSPERVSCLFVNGSPTPAYSEQSWQVIQRADGIFLSKGGERDTNIGWNRRIVGERSELTFLYSQIKSLNPPFNSTTMMDDRVKIFPADFAAYRVPTMIAGGKHDDFLNPQSHFHVASLIPGAETHTFAEAGHSAYFETPGEFNEVLAAFLRRHLPAAV